jgi:hypothetical protein
VEMEAAVAKDLRRRGPVTFVDGEIRSAHEHRKLIRKKTRLAPLISGYLGRFMRR